MRTYPRSIVTLTLGGIGIRNCHCIRTIGTSTYIKYASYTVIYPSNYVAICHGGRSWAVTGRRMALVGNGRTVTRTYVEYNTSNFFNCPVAPRDRVVRALTLLGP